MANKGKNLGARNEANYTKIQPGNSYTLVGDKQ